MPKPVRYETGVYRIRNLINNKVYIGGAYTSFSLREMTHFRDLRNTRHGNDHLQRSYNKYGHSAFVFETLERCKPGRETVAECEQRWINTILPLDPAKCYNKSPTAGSTLGVKFTDESRRRISDIQQNRSEEEKREIYGRISTALTGRKLSDEVRRKLSESQMGREVSQETIDKIKKTRRARLEANPQLAVADSEARSKRSVAWWYDPELGEPRRADRSRKNRDPALRQLVSEAVREKWADPEYRAKQRAAAERLKKRRPIPAHGVRARYIRGCRCDDCKVSNTEYLRKHRNRK